MIVDSSVLKYYAESRIKSYRFLHYNTTGQNKSINTSPNHTLEYNKSAVLDRPPALRKPIGLVLKPLWESQMRINF